MPKDQTWRPLDAKQNGLDCILWISHSQGNGTTPPGTIPGIQADAFGFLDVWELLLVFSSLGTQMPAACHVQSSPEPERAAPRPVGLFFFFLQ